jgi:hypothetical protein
MQSEHVVCSLLNDSRFQLDVNDYAGGEGCCSTMFMDIGVEISLEATELEILRHLDPISSPKIYVFRILHHISGETSS